MILNLDEAAKLLKMSTEGLRRKAKIGEVPAAKPGKCWIFISDDLHKYIRSSYSSNLINSLNINVHNLEAKCQSINVMDQKSIGSPSQRKMEKEYANLLGL